MIENFHFLDNSVICVTLSGKVHWTDDVEPTDLVVLFNENVDDTENLEIVASDCAKYNGSDVAILVTWFSFLSTSQYFQIS